MDKALIAPSRLLPPVLPEILICIMNTGLITLSQVAIPCRWTILVTFCCYISSAPEALPDYFRCPQMVTPCQPATRCIQVCATFSTLIAFHFYILPPAFPEMLISSNFAPPSDFKFLNLLPSSIPVSSPMRTASLSFTCKSRCFGTCSWL